MLSLKTLYWVLPLVSSALAQYGGGPAGKASSTATSAAASSTGTGAAGAVQTVTVGANGGFTFSPNSITADVGSQIVFQFSSDGHSVTQSTWEAPCQPINDTSLNSGFVSAGTGPTDNVFVVTVNDTNPIWFYCAQIGHCQAGMVGVINPPATGDTLGTYVAVAAKAGTSTQPPTVQGGVIEAANKVASGASGSASGSASGTAGAAAATSSKPGEGSSLAASGMVSLLTGLAAVVVGYWMA